MAAETVADIVAGVIEEEEEEEAIEAVLVEDLAEVIREPFAAASEVGSVDAVAGVTTEAGLREAVEGRLMLFLSRPTLTLYNH